MDSTNLSLHMHPILHLTTRMRSQPISWCQTKKYSWSRYRSLLVPQRSASLILQWTHLVASALTWSWACWGNWYFKWQEKEAVWYCRVFQVDHWVCAFLRSVLGNFLRLYLMFHQTYFIRYRSGFQFLRSIFISPDREGIWLPTFLLILHKQHCRASSMESMKKLAKEWAPAPTTCRSPKPKHAPTKHLCSLSYETKILIPAEKTEGGQREVQTKRKLKKP